MECKNISLKFTLQTQTKYKSTKIRTCLQGLLAWDMSFQTSVKNCIPHKVSYCQNLDIRKVSIALS